MNDKILLQISVRQGKNGIPKASIDISPNDAATLLRLLAIIAEGVKQTIDQYATPSKNMTSRGLN